MPSRTALYPIINNAIGNHLSVATARKSFFINEVNKDLKVFAERMVLQQVIDHLLKAVVRFTKNDCIRVAATISDNSIVLTLRENRLRSYFEMEETTQLLHSLANKIGGCITVNSNDGTGSYIALSFYHEVNVA